jgi:hypothetical protein
MNRFYYSSERTSRLYFLGSLKLALSHEAPAASVHFDLFS